MTDDGPQPPIKQVAIAVHLGPATRAWFGSLLVVLLVVVGAVTLFVLCVWCLMSCFLGYATAKKLKTSVHVVLPHSSSNGGWLVDYGKQAPINTTISTAQMGVSHTHGVGMCEISRYYNPTRTNICYCRSCRSYISFLVK